MILFGEIAFFPVCFFQFLLITAAPFVLFSASSSSWISRSPSKFLLIGRDTGVYIS